METLPTSAAENRANRDAALRLAHQRAFSKISGARTSLDYHATVSEAVGELIDACEAYVESQPSL